MMSIPTPVLQFVFIFIIWLHVVQNITGFRYPTRKIVASFNRILIEYNQEKYTLEKSYGWWRQPLPIIILVILFRKSRSWHFKFLMYKYWVQITVLNLVELCLNATNNFMMCYVAVIIRIGWLLVFPTKYNHNILMEIYLCLLMVLYWKISVG